MVVGSPYFTVTAKDGAFEIKNVPPGTYTLKTWSEDGKPTTQSITVGSGALNLALTVTR
ncbi:MAG: carboxypeptidase regulatory-like domain-containing protein [Candidatus Acidiferrales bacterium]